MNKRIQELKAKAMVSDYRHGAFGESESYQTLDTDLFAELIIKECVTQCWSVSETEFEGADISECVKRIKSHFGVK